MCWDKPRVVMLHGASVSGRDRVRSLVLWMEEQGIYFDEL